jgi:hypothetical protein
MYSNQKNSFKTNLIKKNNLIKNKKV